MSAKNARRIGCAAGIIALVISCVAIYAAGKWWPYDTTGEGAKPENYRRGDMPWPRAGKSPWW